MAGWGGARTRSGPPPDPNSERSERRGIKAGMLQLDAKGNSRRPKDFPLLPYVVYVMVQSDVGSMRVKDDDATERWNERERQVWRELWKLPQGIAWRMPEYSYLFHTVALYVRQFVLCESPDAKSADRTTLQRYADTLGLTPQGLKALGWMIVAPGSKKRGGKNADADGKVVPFPSARERFAQMRGDADGGAA